MDSSSRPCYDIRMMDQVKKVLIIDDDKDVLNVLQMALNQGGYEAYMAGGPGEAQEMLRAFQFDLVLCDMTMPGENGKEFRKRMAEVYPELPPFIFCSGVVQEDSQDDLPEGVVGYLTKPFSLIKLLNTVDAAFVSPMNFFRNSEFISPTI